ncbi:MAG: SDR family NAD(P)-dependent oxidoreductase [Solirubrobacteraceae bacterium]|nr:SDR family NAD(P)-dependent oxidoreductase [Solirubrobacteraceae bacterium]
MSLRRRIASSPAVVAAVNGRARTGEDELRAAIAGKTVVVTGASYGIGEATARRLAGAGATVVLVARTAERLEELAAELGPRAHTYACDLTDEDAVGDLALRLLFEHGPPDVLVNNAGKSIRRSIADSTDRFHDFQRTIGVNYLGPVQLTLALLPAMRERRAGHLVNISTSGVRGLPPSPGWSAYQASKAAFDVWSRCVAQEVRPDGVASTSIYFGLVRTRMSAPNFATIPGMSPEDAAALVCDAIVRRPRTAGPSWVGLADVITSGLMRGTTERVMTRAFVRNERARAARRERGA